MDNENAHRAMEILHISGSKYDLPRVQLFWSADEEPARLGANLAIPTSSARLFSLKPCNYAVSVNSQFIGFLFSALQLCSQFLVLKYPAACTVNLKTLESLSISLLMWCDVDLCEVHNFWCKTFTTSPPLHIACVPVISIQVRILQKTWRQDGKKGEHESKGEEEGEKVDGAENELWVSVCICLRVTHPAPSFR